MYLEESMMIYKVAKPDFMEKYYFPIFFKKEPKMDLKRT